MGIGETLLLAFGLSMDACAVAVCKGLACRTVRLRQMLITGLWFGGFQALMPLIGYWCGVAFRRQISAYDHWIAFALLTFLGGKILWKLFQKEEAPADASFAPREMAAMSLATSIDALAVGMTLALLPDIHIYPAVLLIGAVTLVLSALGVGLGGILGAKYQTVARVVGSIILIGMGCKILLEHLIAG
ncbi:MAG: manganese efflux pump [Clostridia bacterium]|nr:manganese efflux pump [Clostridia bacterium]